MLPAGIPLYFVRHGETDWNAERRFQGQTDIPLNDKGRGQAARNGRRLAELLGDPDGYDWVASPLSRASETMTIVRREMGLPLDAFRRDARLMEFHCGHWEGKLLADLPHEDPEGFAGRRADPWGWAARGGESYETLSARVAGWLLEVDEPTVVASHGGVSRVLRGLVVGVTDREVPFLDVPQDLVMLLLDGEMLWL